MTTIISNSIKAQIKGAVLGGNFYLPNQSNFNSVKTSAELFAAVAGKTLEVELISFNFSPMTGRNNSNGFATGDAVFKGVATIKVGTVQSDIRLHVADAGALAKNGGKGIITFSTFKPDGKDVTYLVPQAAERLTAEQVETWVESLATVNETAPVTGP